MGEEWRKTNLRYWPYYGRGFIQLTWEFNYIRYGSELSEPLANSPDLALVPTIAARIFTAYWDSHGIALQAEARDWETVRRRVQGGLAGLDRLVQIAEDLLQAS